MALKLIIAKIHGFETFNCKEVKKRAQRRETIDEIAEKEELEEAPVPLVTLVNNILQSRFSNIEVYINKQQKCNSNVLYAHKSHIFNNLTGRFPEDRGVLHCEGFEYEEFPDKNMEALLSEYFLQG